MQVDELVLFGGGGDEIFQDFSLRRIGRSIFDPMEVEADLADGRARLDVTADFMAEAAKIFHTDRSFTYKVLAKYLRIDDPKIVDAVYRYEVKALEPRLELKAEAIQAILDEVSASIRAPKTSARSS